MRPHDPQQRALARCALVATSLAIVSCGGSGSSTSLSTLEQQQTASAGSARFTDLPNVLDSSSLTAVSEDDPLAWLDLQSAMLTLDEPLIPRPSVTRDTPTNQQDRLRALRLYAVGKSARARNDTSRSIEALTECVQLDPEFAEPWIELALAHREQGDRLAATAAFRNVLARDSENILSLTFVGVEALHRREYNDAAAYLSSAWSRRESISSTAHRHIIAVNLGYALQHLGYLSAAVEAYSHEPISQRETPPPQLVSELANIINTQAERWGDRGDIALRLGQFEQATNAYARAAALPSFNPDALLARRVAAHALQGQSAIGARLLLEEQAQSGGQISETRLELVRYLARDNSVGDAMRAQLDLLESELTLEQLENSATDRLLTRAAMLSQSRARELLRDHILAHPYDDRIVGALFEVLGQVEGDTRLQTLELIRNAPFRHRTYTETLLLYAPDIEEHLRVLLARRNISIEHSLLSTGLLLRTTRDDEASEILERSIERHGNEPALLSARAEIALRRGDSTTALDALALITGDSLDDVLGRVWIHRALGQYDESFAHIEALLQDDPNSKPAPDIMLIGAQLCIARERYEQGVAILDQIIERHPRFEQAHAERIMLYSETGALRDQERFSQAVLALRTVAPSSKTIRWLRAQDLLRSGQYNTAEQELLSLANERLSPQVVRMLVELWLRTGSPERAETWLEHQRRQSPSEPLFVSQLAHVYEQSGRATLAGQMLEDWVTSRPGDIALSRQLESLYRGVLQNPERADELVFARLQRAPKTPQTSLEMALLQRSRKEFSSAVETLKTMLGAKPTLSGSQSQMLHQEALILAQAALQQLTDSSPQVLHLFKTILNREEKAPDELLGMYVLLLIEAQADTTEILDALGMVGESNAELASRLYDDTSKLYYEQGRLPEAVRLCKQAVGTLVNPSRFVLTILIQASYYELDFDGAILAVETAHRLGYAKEFEPINLPNAEVDRDSQAAAELTYDYATWFAVNNKIEMSHTLYRLALQFNPNHIMANNNLGYSLADLDMSLDEAHRLILHAYSLDSKQGSITDSLGWIRYKLGEFHDTLDDQGVVVREGALTLLARAATMDDARDDHVVHDHLGDVSWRTGDKEQAVAQWTSAAALLETSIPVLNPGANEAQRNLRREMLELREAIQNKLDAVEAGTEPRVAPTTSDRDDDSSLR